VEETGFKIKTTTMPFDTQQQCLSIQNNK